MLNATTALATCLVTETRRGRAVAVMRPGRHAVRALTTALFFTCEPEQRLPQRLQRPLDGLAAFFRAEESRATTAPADSHRPRNNTARGSLRVERCAGRRGSDASQGVPRRGASTDSGPISFDGASNGTTERAGGDASPANNASLPSRQRQRKLGLRESGLTDGIARGLLVVARRCQPHGASSSRISEAVEIVTLGVVEAPKGTQAAAGFNSGYARERGCSEAVSDLGAIPSGSTTQHREKGRRGVPEKRARDGLRNGAVSNARRALVLGGRP
jgi:hypothetical protein